MEIGRSMRLRIRGTSERTSAGVWHGHSHEQVVSAPIVAREPRVCGRTLPRNRRASPQYIDCAMRINWRGG
eukprot:6940590-Lingulodinium_polyedra.AAC.1